MAEQFPSLNQDHIDFIEKQHMYFVGTAGAEGRVNVSPKGSDSLRIIDNNTIAWLNLTGSGNETAAHVLENERMTIAFCSFEKAPLILRVYGTARAVHERDAEWNDYIDRFPSYTGARQVFLLTVEMVQTSCGFAVPYYEYKGDRETLNKWSNKEGREGIKEYWKENEVSLDGKPTGIFEE